MRALLLTLALAAPLAAQAPPDSSDARRPAPRAELYLGGVAGSYVLAQTVGSIGGLSEASEGWGTLLAIPVGAALGVIGTGRLLGLPGSAGGAARGATRGALIGLVVVPAVVWTTGGDFPFATTEAEAAVITATVVAAAVLPTVLAARGYTAGPVQMRAPDGTTAPGVALRVRL